MMDTVANIFAVARREFLVRVRTRSFLLGTVALLLGVVAIAMVPVIVRFIDRGTQQHVAVWTEPSDIGVDPVATIDALLNAPPASGTASGTPSPTEAKDYVVTAVGDLATARQATLDGTYVGVLAIRRGAGGDLAFTLYTDERATSRVAQTIRQATSAVAVGDRLQRLGVAPADQGGLFAPPTYGVAWPDPARTDPAPGALDEGADDLLGFGMTVVIFMMIVLYGNWVAMSVVEEKSSRVMEVILNAATPFQLLAGKVLGVGALALVQYLGLLLAGGIALALQAPVASMLLGGGGGEVSLPAGLTLGMLAMLVVYGILGFLLYAVLYAAAGSLVSRQEDVTVAVMPMALVSTAGYLVAVYSATGLLDIRAGWIAALAQVPFVSPFLMLTRTTAGEAALWEIPLSIAILAVSIVAALWVASRIYAAGVLLYGQRPGFRTVWRLIRAGA